MAKIPDPFAWFKLGMNAWTLGAESNAVIWMRCMRMAQGGPVAEREAVRMVTEKWQAQVELAGALATGRLGTDAESIAGGAIKHYQKRVRANRSRLAGWVSRPSGARSKPLNTPD